MVSEVSNASLASFAYHSARQLLWTTVLRSNIELGRACNAGSTLSLLHIETSEA